MPTFAAGCHSVRRPSVSSMSPDPFEFGDGQPTPNRYKRFSMPTIRDGLQNLGDSG
jgi:hypothetical protein